MQQIKTRDYICCYLNHYNLYFIFTLILKEIYVVISFNEYIIIFQNENNNNLLKKNIVLDEKNINCNYLSIGKK